MSVTLDQEDLRNIMNKLDGLGRPAAMRRAMTRSVDHLNGKLQKDSTKARGAFSAMATPAQRRAFWAKVSSGEARVDGQGYVRTHRLYRDWKKEVSPDGRRGEVYNENSGGYAQFVQGDRQQPFHRASNYPTDKAVAEKEGPFVIKIWEREYERQLNR